MRNFTIFLSLAFLLASSSLFAQSSSFWNTIKESEIEMGGTRYIDPTSYETFQLDIDAIDEVLLTSPTEIVGQLTPSNVVFSMPDPDGNMVDFNIYYSPVVEQPLADLFPDIRTYAGYSADGSYVRLDHTPKGFHAMVWPRKGGIYFIDPYNFGTIDPEYYVIYRKRDHRRVVPEVMSCSVNGESALDIHDIFDQNARYGDCQLRTYRLALGATGEYTAFHGGTVAGALAAQVTSMNRVNGVFELEMSIRMNIIGNNNLIIYTNAGSDPYTNTNGSSMLGENQTTCDGVIGSSNYDIGHVFSTGGGGVAYLQSPCNNSVKAGGVTGSGSPVGDTFDVDYVAHEMGHQFGCNHTQNNSCNR
ncbi:MAG: hypothetical protein ACI9P8_001612, partial [Bacteroidia bacterium]